MPSASAGPANTAAANSDAAPKLADLIIVASLPIRRVVVIRRDRPVKQQQTILQCAVGSTPCRPSHTLR
jgi:hypothetical protein